LPDPGKVQGPERQGIKIALHSNLGHIRAAEPALGCLRQVQHLPAAVAHRLAHHAVKRHSVFCSQQTAIPVRCAARARAMAIDPDHPVHNRERRLHKRHHIYQNLTEGGYPRPDQVQLTFSPADHCPKQVLHRASV
jgi:hypothetical protein